jgi:serine/threonine protein kinase
MKTMVSTAGGLSGALESSDVLAPGSKAGPWLVERELGRGGMGAVYAVVHEEIGKRAALKVVHQRLLVPGFNSDRMLLEAKVVNQVGHPNIVDIFETGTLGDGRPYIVMERLEGQPLSVRADDGKVLPDLVIAILLQICDALIAAHAAGVVHRDLKLDNVFLVDNLDDPSTPKVKLLDWGIAKVINHDVKHTIDGQLVGTPQYLSPEQARGQLVTPQSDVYSLGVMAYELFLEQLPFEAETAAEVMAMHLRAVPPPPSELWPDVPTQLENLLLAMLAKQPDQRPTMFEVARRLETVRDELVRRRLAHDFPRHITATPIDASRPNRKISSAGFAATDLASSQTGEHRGGTKRWQFAVGAFALATSAMLFWISHVGDQAAAAATSLDQGALHDAPTLVRMPVRETSTLTATAQGAPVTDLDPRHSAAAEVAAPPAATTARAPTTRHAGRVTTSAPTARPALRSTAASRPSRPAPVVPRRGTKVDPDGTFDVYR